MGLNLGVRVKQQPEGTYQFGRNPKGAPEEIADRLYDHIAARFATEGFGISVELREGWWEFDCRVHGYGRYLRPGVDTYDLHREIILWAWEQFDDSEGVEMKTYYVP